MTDGTHTRTGELIETWTRDAIPDRPCDQGYSPYYNSHHPGPWKCDHAKDAMAFAAIPASRRDDPDSSMQAEERVTQSGIRSKQALTCLKILLDYDGRSSKVLAKCTNRLDRYQLARRLPELEKLGYVRREEQPDGGDTHWFLTDNGRNAAKGE